MSRSLLHATTGACVQVRGKKVVLLCHALCKGTLHLLLCWCSWLYHLLNAPQCNCVCTGGRKGTKDRRGNRKKDGQRQYMIIARLLDSEWQLTLQGQCFPWERTWGWGTPALQTDSPMPSLRLHPPLQSGHLHCCQTLGQPPHRQGQASYSGHTLGEVQLFVSACDFEN